MKENWIKDMKKRLEGHQMVPPEGLWEAIGSEMGFGNEPARKIAVGRWWRWAVAAGIAAVVGFFAFYHPDGRQPLAQTGQNSVLPSPVEPSQPQEAAVEPSAAQPSLLAHISTKSVAVSNREFHLENEVPTTEKSSENQVLTPENEPAQENEATPTPQTPEKNDSATEILPPKPDFREKTAEKHRKIGLGLNVSSGLLATITPQTNPLYDYADASNGTTDFEPSTPSKKTEYEAKHRLPVRVGMSLRYELSPRLALMSGINYTFLSSEFKYPFYPTLNHKQTLHYLGIPLGLSLKLYDSGAFRVYLSGSGMLEKSLNERPWQVSVSAAAGAEYSLTPQFGLYLEPSLGYYFNDGTSLEHYYKEHPVAPSIQFGFRFTY